jgi:hypothetical protein
MDNNNNYIDYNNINNDIYNNNNDYHNTTPRMLPNYRDIEIELSDFLYQYLSEIYDNYQQYKIHYSVNDIDNLGLTYIDHILDEIEDAIIDEFNRYFNTINYKDFLNNVFLSLPKHLYNFLYVMINRIHIHNIHNIKDIKIDDINDISDVSEIIKTIGYFIANNIFVHSDFDITYNDL